MKSSWIQVDLHALEYNIRQIKTAMRPETSIIFVVKDRAYGHGLKPIVKKAADIGINWFGVAYVEEAVQVRAVAPDANIVVLGVAEPSDVPVLLSQKITPVIVSGEHGRALGRIAVKHGGKVKGHLKIDTGMGRLGVLWEEALNAFTGLDQVDGLELTGLCTHFASVELKKPSLGAIQMERFLVAEKSIRSIAGRKLFRHVSSSRAILYQDEWDLDGVRPGILLYGYGANDKRMRFHTRPILQWKAVVMQVKKMPAGMPIGYYGTYVTEKETRIATIAAGYADGYHRALSNKGFVLIRGKRCPVVGRVSMNWITADVGLESEAQAGDEVVLIGEQNGESIWADELARLARTIPYELLTSIDALAEREFITNN